MFTFSGLDLTTLIIPLLALVGLFLLFPTYVTLTSVRYIIILLIITRSSSNIIIIAMVKNT